MWFWLLVTAAAGGAGCGLSRGDRAFSFGLALVCIVVCFVSNLLSDFRRHLPPGKGTSRYDVRIGGGRAFMKSGRMEVA